MRLEKIERTALGILGAGIVLMGSVFAMHQEHSKAVRLSELEEQVTRQSIPKDPTAEAALKWLNEATAEELTILPGIGEAMAERIVSYRESAGGLETVEELQNVRGIGEKRLTQITEFMTAWETAK